MASSDQAGADKLKLSPAPAFAFSPQPVSEKSRRSGTLRPFIA
jgi:hypothetical protein